MNISQGPITVFDIDKVPSRERVYDKCAVIFARILNKQVLHH